MKASARVVLYPGPGCRLCKEMKQEIGAAGLNELYGRAEMTSKAPPNCSSVTQHEIPVIHQWSGGV